MPEAIDVPVPSVAWFKEVREAIKRKNAALVPDFAILLNQPNAGTRMLDFLDEHFPIDVYWTDIPVEAVPERLRNWQGA